MFGPLRLGDMLGPENPKTDGTPFSLQTHFGEVILHPKSLAAKKHILTKPIWFAEIVFLALGSLKSRSFMEIGECKSIQTHGKQHQQGSENQARNHVMSECIEASHSGHGVWELFYGRTKLVSDSMTLPLRRERNTK